MDKVWLVFSSDWGSNHLIHVCKTKTIADKLATLEIEVAGWNNIFVKEQVVIDLV